MNWHMDHYIVKKQTHVKNTMINSIIDDNGNIIDKKIEEDVNRKVEWIYIHEKLYFARRKVKRLKLYKKKIVEMNEALDNDDVERVIDIMCFEEKREIVPDPLEKKLKRYWSIDGNSSFQWKTMEEKKEETRKLYQTRGIDCFKQNAKRYAEIFFKSENIDELISVAKHEQIRIKTIIKRNSVSDACQLLHEFGACHRIWAIKKSILKTDYGIEWKTPSERFSDVRFD